MKIWQAVIASMLSLASTALAQEQEQSPSEGPECRGTFSIVHPLPSHCMGPIDTDRPHQTDTPVVVDAGHFQFETSVVSLERESYRKSSPSVLTVGDNAYKLGLYNGIDLQLFHAVLIHEGGHTDVGKEITLRAKFQLIGDNHSESGLTLVPLVIVPLTHGIVGGGGHLFFGQELPWNLDLELNAGAISAADATGARRTVPIFSTALTKSFSETFAVFGEARLESWDAHLAVWDTFLDTGVIVHLTHDVQVDAGVYNGVSGNAPKLTAFLGFSLRI
jgi:hypothetical protein